MNWRVKTPTLLQMEMTECGACALAMILHHFKAYIPVSRLRHDCGVSRDGSNLFGMVKTAKKYNLKANAFKMNADELLKEATLSIIFWNNNHFVVLEGQKKETIYINDPANGPRKVTYEEFKKNYSGVVVFISPNDNFKPQGKASSPLHKLFNYVSDIKLPLLYVFTISILFSLVNFLPPLLLKIFTDHVLLSGNKNISTFIIPAAGVALILILILRYTQLTIINKLRVALSINLVARCIWKILHLPSLFFVNRSIGDIVSRTQANDEIAGILAGEIVINIINIVTMALTIIIMFILNIWLAGITLGLGLVCFLLLLLINRKRKDLTFQIEMERGKYLGAGIHCIKTIEIIKSTDGGSAYFSKLIGMQTTIINLTQRANILLQQIALLPQLLMWLAIALSLGIGGYLAMQGKITLGTVMAFQGLIMIFFQPVTVLVMLISQLQSIHGKLRRLDDIESHEIDPLFEQKDITPTHLIQSVKVNNLSFQYSILSVPILKEICFQIEPKKITGIGGKSGCGKSTLVRLLCGLYQPTSGEVILDNHNLKAYSGTLLAQSIALVEQGNMFFSGTIKDNLTLWDSDISDAFVEEVCQKLHILDVINAFEFGFEHTIDANAEEFSGGERQRLAIARAMLKKPSILILDDATSALDSELECHLYTMLKKEKITTISISNRVSALSLCDTILILHDSEIVANGHYESLLNSNTYFQQLVKGELCQ